MNYKETLFFVAKCLTISLEEKNKQEVEQQLKTQKIDWDAVVKLSTTHYVFPALYCNLKRANFLSYLPEELVEYMQHITDLNRERNEQIISQAKEINELLMSHNITTIFLKGTGNLLEGLYEDIAERMVGDIDFIFSKEDYPKAIEVLTENNYSKVVKSDYDFPQFKHYPRLQKENRIAAVEIHKELLLEKYAHEFNYNFVEKTKQKINGINVMSFNNQLSLSIIAKQINDDGFHFKTIALRNAYDVFLLSKKTVAKDAFQKFDTLQNPLNCFLAICYTTFNNINSLNFTKTSETEKYLAIYNDYLLNESKRNSTHKKKSTELFIKKRMSIIYKSIFDKEYRNWLLKRITDKKWQQEKLVQLRLKKAKPNA
ncbi:nucleotidyltransferase family protein [Polaribacter batillariae]|uniref:Nucleotidyltransferase family protein n=1 Tax=Polaribacter batillariae TaxID=2808900 RepID=A0ABX7SS52_9FLAO|nr:nucleotidyltransferase family protein [Polaribacter batillariae]QTD37067.1 nucleotidyltransferase family protein [Polaribacter batillariae]